MPNYFKSHTIKDKKRNRDAEFMKHILDNLDFDYNNSSFISSRCTVSRFESSKITQTPIKNSPKHRKSFSPINRTA